MEVKNTHKNEHQNSGARS